MAVIKTPIRVPAAVTLPSGVLPMTLPTAESERFYDGNSLSVAQLPSLKGWAVANGVDPIRLIVRDAVYDCGILAPSAVMTTAVTGAARATATLECGAANPGANDRILVTVTYGSRTITFVAALDVSGASGDQVLIGADIDTTLGYLKALINGDPGSGATYVNSLEALGFSAFEFTGIECPSAVNTTDHSLLFRVTSYGAAGNTYLARIVLDTANGFTTGLGTGFFDTAGTFSGGSDATPGDPATGTYAYKPAYYRDATLGMSGLGPEVSHTNVADNIVAVSGLTASEDATVDYTRLYRTTKSGTEFRLAVQIARAGTTATDDRSDDRLREYGNFPVDERAFRSYREGLPPKARWLALWNGRLFGIGRSRAAEYGRGTAAVTQTTTGADNATVVLSGVNLSTRVLMRTFQVASTPQKYLILKASRTGSQQWTLTLDRGYEGSTNASASYAIRDESSAARLECSEPFLFDQWPTRNDAGEIDSDDDIGGTGLLATDDALYAFSRTTITRLTGNGPLDWQLHKVVDNVGCVAGNTIVGVPGFGWMWLGVGAIYSWGGAGQPSPVSSVGVGRNATPRGIDATVARIAWAHVDQSYAVYDAEQKIVWFAVPLDGAAYPTHRLVLDLERPGRWSVDEISKHTAAGEVTGPDGKRVVLMGDALGRLWHDNIGTTDGAYGFVSVLTVATGTVRSATFSGTPLPTSGDGVVGAPLTIVYANGTTVRRKVVSNANNSVVWDEDVATAPTSADQIAFGCIDADLDTGRFALDEDWRAKKLLGVVVSHGPEAASAASDTTKEYHFAFAEDQDTEAICARGWDRGDLTNSEGRRRFQINRKAFLHKFRVRCLDPEATFYIRGFTLRVDDGSPDPEVG